MPSIMRNSFKNDFLPLVSSTLCKPLNSVYLRVNINGGVNQGLQKMETLDSALGCTVTTGSGSWV